MAYWFEKNDMRRFRRVDIPARLLIVPSRPTRTGDIFTYGIDYFPPSVQKRLQHAQSKMHYWINHIQEQQDILAPVFAEFERYSRYFGGWVESVSQQARSPRTEVASWLEFHAYGKGVQDLEELKAHAPKTFQYFDLLNQKMQAYYRHFSTCLEKSDASQFQMPEPLESYFEIDGLAKNFAASVNHDQKVPLVQALYYLYLYTSYYFRAYDEMLNDFSPPASPKAWRQKEINLSAGGLSVLLDKRYPANSRCAIHLFFPDTGQRLDFEASFVRSFTASHTHKETNAFNFNFPDGHSQKVVVFEIERYEIRSSMAVAAF